MSKITLQDQALKELEWWIENLQLCNGKSLIQSQSQALLQTGASLKGWGAVCQGTKTGGQWSKSERNLHINHLLMLAIKLAILTFSKMLKLPSFHIQVDNKTALSYLMKLGGTTSLLLTLLSKEIWTFLLQDKIMINAEYLPGVLNIQADWES